MPEFVAWYPPRRSAHVGLVLASGGLFALRGARMAHLCMISVALAHHPLGFLRDWMAHAR